MPLNEPSNLQPPTSNLQFSWPVQGTSGKSATGSIFALVALIMAGGPGYAMSRHLNITIPVYAFVAAGLLAFLIIVRMGRAMTTRKGVMALDGPNLTLALGKTTQRLNIPTCTLRFNEHFVARSYSMRMGTVCSLHAAGNEKPIRILGYGAEFSTDRYTGTPTFAADYDVYLPAAEFQEFLDALAAVRPDDTSLSQAAAEDEQALDFSQERAFRAFPMRGNVLRPILTWVIGISLLSMASFFGASFFGAGGPGVAAPPPWLIIGGVVLFMILSVRSASKANKRDGRLRFQANALIFEIDGKTKRRLEPPLTQARPVQMRVASRSRSYYAGPAVQLRDARNRKLTILISDTTRHWPNPERTIRAADCSISSDAAATLQQWLAIHNHLLPLD